jgi:hypothetical protein
LAVNWGLGQPQGGAYDYLDSLQQMGQIAAQKQGLAQNQYNFNRQRTADQQRPQILQQARGGDYAGAQDTAFANGDLDAFKVISGLQDDQRKQVGEHADTIAAVAANLSTLPEGPDRLAAFDAALPALQARGFTPDELAHARGNLSNNGLKGYLAAASNTKAALEAYAKSQAPVTLVDGAQEFGATPMGGGPRPLIAENQKDIVPQKPVWDSERGGWVYPPSAGAPTGSMTPLGGGAPGAAAGQISADRLLPLFVAQESGGNYKAKNAETGALGRYQVMPQTGAALAKGAGMPWRPELMTSDSAEGRQYQDTLGKAAVSEAVNASGGDPAKAFGYYYSGTTDQSKWGPKTRKYIADMQQRLGGQSAPPQSAPSGGGFVPVVAPKNKDYRILSPQEAQQRGLDPQSKWQIGPNNQIASLPAKGDKPLTEIQAKAASYLGTMLEASRSLSEVRGYQPSNVSIALDALSNGNPVREGLNQVERRVLNAQQAFAGAALRLESGAVINDQEIARKARALFPLPGDGPDVQADKRRQREAAIKGMRIVAGPGSDQYAPLGDTSKTGANAPRPQPKAGWKIVERK